MQFTLSAALNAVRASLKTILCGVAACVLRIIHYKNQRHYVPLLHWPHSLPKINSIFCASASEWVIPTPTKTQPNATLSNPPLLPTHPPSHSRPITRTLQRHHHTSAPIRASTQAVPRSCTTSATARPRPRRPHRAHAPPAMGSLCCCEERPAESSKQKPVRTAGGGPPAPKVMTPTETERRAAAAAAADERARLGAVRGTQRTAYVP